MLSDGQVTGLAQGQLGAGPGCMLVGIGWRAGSLYQLTCAHWGAAYRGKLCSVGDKEDTLVPIPWGRSKSHRGREEGLVGPQRPCLLDFVQSGPQAQKPNVMG